MGTSWFDTAVGRLVEQGKTSAEAARQASAQDRCPGCGAPASRSAFHCDYCGLLGRGVGLEGRPPATTSLVRALLSPAAEGEMDSQAAVLSEEARTAIYDAPVGDVDVPCFTTGFDWASAMLSPLEAQLAPLVDGRSTIAQLAASARLSSIEACAVLRSLVTRGLISFAPVPVLDEEPQTIQAGSSMHLLAKTMHDSSASGSDQSALHRAIRLEQADKAEEALALLEEALGEDAALVNRLGCVVLGIRQDASAAERLFRRACNLDARRPTFEANLHAVASIADRF